MRHPKGGAIRALTRQRPTGRAGSAGRPTTARFTRNFVPCILSNRLLGDDMASTEVAKLQVHAEDVTQPRKSCDKKDSCQRRQLRTRGLKTRELFAPDRLWSVLNRHTTQASPAGSPDQRGET